MPPLSNAQNVHTGFCADYGKIARTEKEYDPKTGQPTFRPVYGVKDCYFKSPPAAEIKFSDHMLEKWKKRGFVTCEGEKPMTFPGGPNGQHGRKYDPWRQDKIRNSVWYNRITFHCKNYGELVYEVVLNPGKYYSEDHVPVTAETIDRYGEDTYALWEYHCRRVDQPME